MDKTLRLWSQGPQDMLERFLYTFFNFSHKVDIYKYVDIKHHHLTPNDKEFID